MNISSELNDLKKSTAKALTIVAALFFGDSSMVNGRSVELQLPPDVPSVVFIRDQIPTAKTVTVTGTTYDALVPDTCDLQEDARLFLENYLTEITVDNAQYYHEPFNRGDFIQVPPRLTLDIGSYLCGLPKFRESLPLLRVMTGSQKDTEIDAAWSAQLLKCIGPDGLYYVPRTGRPWDDKAGSGSTRSAYWWTMPANASFYAALPLGNGRLLGSLAIYYQMTGDEVWNSTARAIVDRMNQLAITSGDAAFYTKFVWQPGESLSDAQKAAAAADWKQSLDAAQRSPLWKITNGETDRNTPLWQTWMITGLSQYYRVSHYEPAKTLAVKLANFLRETHYVEEWKSHFHCITLGIQALLEVAEITGDRDLAEYARRAYEDAKSGRHMVALPSIGYFVNSQRNEPMEGCSIADMTAIAAKLAKIGMGDQYYEDVDRYTRNCLTGIQRTNTDEIETILAKSAVASSAKAAPVTFDELSDDLPTRLVGSFSSYSLPNDKFGGTYFDTCCQGNISRALFYAWQSILSYDQGTLTIHLLLNRTSPWADIDSYIPYSGRVEIHVKQALQNLRVRLNDWIAADKVVCAIDGRAQEFKLDGRYVALGKIDKNQTVTLEFPIVEKTEKAQSFVYSFNITFRGNDAVKIDPPGTTCPLFERPYYRSSQARYLKVQRFVCDDQIDH